MIQPPYIEEQEIIIHRRYNPNYGNNRLCICGHVYYRHFDSYTDMENVGCKYCSCGDFKEFAGEYSVIDTFVRENAPEKYKELQENRAQFLKQYNITGRSAPMTMADSQQAFNENLLEEHYRMTQRIIQPLLGTWIEGQPHPQDIEED